MYSQLVCPVPHVYIITNVTFCTRAYTITNVTAEMRTELLYTIYQVLYVYV